METLFAVLTYLLRVATWLIFAHVILSWLLQFQVLNARQPLVQQIWIGLSRTLEPVYAPVRRVLPRTAGLDLAPLVVLIGIQVLQIVLSRNAGAFG